MQVLQGLVLRAVMHAHVFNTVKKYSKCRGVRRILKRWVTYRKGSNRGRVREGDVPPPPRESRKPSGAVPFEAIISLRNQQDSTFS